MTETAMERMETMARLVQRALAVYLVDPRAEGCRRVERRRVDRVGPLAWVVAVARPPFS